MLSNNPIRFDPKSMQYFVWVSTFGIKWMKYFSTAPKAAEYILENRAKCFESRDGFSPDKVNEHVKNAEAFAEYWQNPSASGGAANGQSNHGAGEKRIDHSVRDNLDSNRRVFSCPSCSQKIRVRIPLAGGRVRCSQCRASMALSADEFGNLYVTKDLHSNQDGEPRTVEECFKLLGLSHAASGEDIRRAYRVRMKEYHPDRVAHLGEKLRSVADAEASKLNVAMEMLKSNGLVGGA